MTWIYEVCLIETTYSPRLPARSDDIPKRKQKMRRAYRQLDYNLYDQAASALEAFAGQLGFWPRLVFDRGFGGCKFIRMLTAHKATFYIRLKAGRLVEHKGRRVAVSRLPEDDTIITLDGMRLRVVRSDDPETGEPWFILTSDMRSRRREIIRIYYYRFEIEETFKDIKHVLELDSTKLMKPLSLKVLLWFAALSLILSFLVGWWEQIKRPRHPKKQLSHYKQFFEAVQREAYGPMAYLITGGLGK